MEKPREGISEANYALALGEWADCGLAMFLREVYYVVKPFVPRRLQLFLRSRLILGKLKACSHIWPIDKKANKLPEDWRGWPDNKRFALVVTHDVDTERGQRRCRDLMQAEESLAFRSSFNFVPERYEVNFKLQDRLVAEGFEVGVHGLNHDGKLYQSRKVFRERAGKINGYLKDWGAVGFRSPAMHHNLEWLHDLNIEYDASTFDTDPFEPQPDGVRTIFPFWVPGNSDQGGYVELPYTLPQDFTLFVLMKEKNFEIWKRKLDWIAQHGGMALVNTHPDYMHFGPGKSGIEEYPARYYEDLLKYIKDKYEGQYWHVLPREMARYWVENVVKRGDRRKARGTGR